MQKGSVLITVIILVLILVLLAGYLIFSRGMVTPGSSKTKPLFFGEYSLILQEGFKANEVITSGIEPSFDICTFDPEQLSPKNMPCKYAVIESIEDETKIIISDTRKWGLGGGGYITTFNEKIKLGPKGYETEFSSIWIAGEVDENGVATEKLFLENGQPVLYYTTGCIRPTLCIHMNAKQNSEDGFGYPDNSWQLEKFKQFVNSLEIKQLDMPTAPQNYMNKEWKFALTIPEGYLINGANGLFHITKKPTSGNETPLPEITVKAEQSSKIAISSEEGMEVVSREPVVINNVKGYKTIVSYDNYPEGNQCPIYIFNQGGVAYEVSLYECLESDIFETLVKSFKITP